MPSGSKSLPGPNVDPDFCRYIASLRDSELMDPCDYNKTQQDAQSCKYFFPLQWHHKISTIASQITSLTIAYSTVYSGADQRKHQIFASLAFVWGIYRWLVNSPHKWPVTRKMFPFDDVIMSTDVRYIKCRLTHYPLVTVYGDKDIEPY